MPFEQQQRLLALHTPLGKDALLLIGVNGTEGLSQPSRFTLDVLAPREIPIDMKALLGKPVNVDMELDDGEYRVFNGLIDQVYRQGIVDKEFQRYQLVIITQLDLLAKRIDQRLFQNKSALDIVKAVFDQHKVTYRDITMQSYAPRVYCTQYQESDLDFVQRLLQEEGIVYNITHEAGKHTVVLFDHSARYQPSTEPHLEVVDGSSSKRRFYNWRKTFSQTSGQVMQRSFNKNVPFAPIQAHTGSAVVTNSTQAHEQYHYPGLTNENADSDQEIKRRQQRIDHAHTRVSVSTNCRTLAPGQTLKFDRHLMDRECQYTYVVSHAHYVAKDDTYLNQQDDDGDTQTIESHLQCLPAEQLYRDAVPRPRPSVHGCQTAIVCGPKGEEIFTDNEGRIKVQFPWDREGKYDDNSSCWIRVAQLWANSGFGGQFVPRIGQEVFVHFEEGDIDKPLVMGVAYNGRNAPAFDLPANKTQTGIKTRSSKGANTLEHNALRFEDKRGQEEVYLQAQKNQTSVIKHNHTRGIGNNHYTSVGSNKFEVIKKTRNTLLAKGHDHLQTKGDIAVQSVAGRIVIETPNTLELRTGQSKIVLKPNGHLLINGLNVNIDGSSKVDINGGAGASPKRLSPAKVGDVFTTPASPGGRVDNLNIAVEPPKPAAAPIVHTSSRQAVFTVADQQRITIAMDAAEKAGDTEEFNRLKQVLIDNVSTSSMEGFPPTADQKALVASGDFKGYWQSVYDQSEGKLGRTELIGWGGADYVNPQASAFEKASATATWTALDTYIKGAEALGKTMPSMEDIGKELAKGHFEMRELDDINTSALLSRQQHARYHHKVFKRYGIPEELFGGTAAGLSPELYGHFWAPNADVDTAGPIRQLFGYAGGKDMAEIYAGPTTDLSQKYADSHMAKAVEKFMMDKYDGQIPTDGFMYNYDRRFDAPQFLDDMIDPNLSSHMTGSVQDCYAVVKGDYTHFRCNNVMGLNSASAGNQRDSGQGFFNDIPANADGTREPLSNINYTIGWKTRNDQLNTETAPIETAFDTAKDIYNDAKETIDDIKNWFND